MANLAVFQRDSLDSVAAMEQLGMLTSAVNRDVSTR